jgi:integrase
LLKRAAEKAEEAARVVGDRDSRFPVHVGLNALRHTAIEKLHGAGVPVDVAAKLAGHTPQTMLKHYSRLTEERRQGAGEQIARYLDGDAASKRKKAGGYAP